MFFFFFQLDVFFICLPQYTISIIFHTLYTQLSSANQISCFFFLILTGTRCQG